MVMRAPYGYGRIQAESEIRLLELQPGTGDDPIQVLLPTAALETLPEYEALSYCWGAATDTQGIICEDGAFDVTVNLFSALHHLRDASRPRTLWVDAICINQGDLLEKSRQILHMPKIYSCARHVVIWVGEHTKDVEGVDVCIAEGLSLVPAVPVNTVEAQGIVRRVLSDARALQEEGKPNVLDHDWSPLCSLLSRPWFTRKWIVQEACLAPAATVVCGKIEFPWDHLAMLGLNMVLSDVARLISGDTGIIPRKVALDPASFTLALQNIQIMAMIKAFRGQGDLLDAVIATTMFNCINPRDHLYALLSIPSRGSSVVPDYTLSTEEVYTDFAVSTLVDQKNLRILGLAPGTAETQMEFPRKIDPMILPSWVPNFSGDGARTSLCGFSLFPPIYSAGGSDTPAVRVSDDKKRLFCQGRIVDTVQSLSPRDKYVHGNVEEWEHALPQFSGSKILLGKHVFTRLWLIQSKGFIFPGRAGLTEEEWVKFGRIMTCLQVSSQEEIPPETLEAFEAYFTHVTGLIERGGGAAEPAGETVLTEHGLLIETSLFRVAQHRTLCQTKEGRFAQVPTTTQDGDVLAILYGAEAPFVLRRAKEGTGVYELIGQAYLDGMMHGEGLKDRKEVPTEIVIQ